MTLEELNALALSDDADEFIRVSEARQVKDLSRIADAFCDAAGKRVVLLAGGSSAGKTTTAKRLATQIRVNGRRAVHLSTDDYFVGDKRNPRDADGNLDYEHVECVDIPRLVSDLNRLIAGETIRPRRFDFIKHEGYDADGVFAIPKDGVIVLEGIHALNPRLVEGMDPAALFRLYVDPKPPLEVFGVTRLTSEDARLLRRLVRDCHYRGLDPAATFAIWPKVLAGERRWIHPFRDGADETFDSYLPYEMTVLKSYVQGLLKRLVASGAADPRAERFSDLLDAVVALSPNAVPGDSILRETIGGSQLAY